MKIAMILISLLAMAYHQTEGQNDVIEFKNGKKVEAKIKSHTKTTLTTDKATHKIKEIKSIVFFTKNYDDLAFYTQLEKAGVEYRFAVTPH